MMTKTIITLQKIKVLATENSVAKTLKSITNILATDLVTDNSPSLKFSGCKKSATGATPISKFSDGINTCR